MFDHEDQPMAHDLGGLHRDAQGLSVGGTLWHSHVGKHAHALTLEVGAGLILKRLEVQLLELW